MNIHPFFVHFPLAFLTVYAVLELARFRFVTARSWHAPLKTGLLYIGAIAALPTFVTGGIAEEITKRTIAVPEKLIENHALFISLGAWAFIALAVFEFLAWKGKPWAERFVRSTFVPVVAGVGLVCLLLGGALGAAIVYGPEADVFVRTVLSLIPYT